jgi:putative flippase GtrA
MPKLIDKLPAAIGSRLRTRFGKQFSRFAIVAIVSLAASEIALFVFTMLVHMTYGASGVLAAVVGAVVSYILSRWAWQRKGRPDVLRETLPFWIVSAGAWLVLGVATKLGHHLATSMGVHGFKHFIVVGGIYFIANCLTFFTRFLIFHFVLFADRGAKSGPPESETLSPIGASVAGSDDKQDNQPPA